MQAKHALSRSGGLMPSEELSENMDEHHMRHSVAGGRDGTRSDAELSGSVSPDAGSPVRPAESEQRVPASPPLVAVGSPTGASSVSVSSRHSDDYREHLRIRARALQTEQEQLEAGAAAAAVRPDSPEAPAAGLSPSRTDEIGTGANLTQTHHTSQRIGELDLALDRLLHRLAPSSSDQVNGPGPATYATAPSMHQSCLQLGHEVPLPAISAGSPLGSPARLSATAARTSADRQLDYDYDYAVAPLSTDANVDVVGPRFQQSVRNIDLVERQLTDLQERYQAMATEPGDDATNDTMSCSSLSDDTASSHAKSTQSFLVQSDLSDDGTRD